MNTELDLGIYGLLFVVFLKNSIVSNCKHEFGGVVCVYINE